MSVATASRRYLVAQAAIRSDAIIHLTSERDSGALNPVCGAHPVRSSKINLWPSPEGPDLPADLRSFCTDCADWLLHVPGIDSIEQGIATMTGAGSSTARTRLLQIPLDQILIDEDRARRDGGDIEALAESVRAVGILQPIIVREVAAGYELTPGLRRFAAARMADLDTIPALVRVLDDEETILTALSENLHRADLNPIDEAHQYQHAMATLGLKQVELAPKIAIKQPTISNAIRLLSLPAEVQDLIAAGAVGAAHARELLKLDSTADQIDLARQIAAHGLSVKETIKHRTGGAALTTKHADLAQLLTMALAAKVLVTTRGDRARVTIDVADDDLDRLLEQLAGVDLAVQHVPVA